MFSPPLTRAQSLADDIERLMLDRGLRPGERIATMDELRDQSRLGRATISEAARLLTERGTVDVRPGRGGGLFVATVGQTVRLRHTLLAAGDDAAGVAHALAVRDALEELIDTDAARHRTNDDVTALAAIIERMRTEAVTREAFLEQNWQLHTRIAQITPNNIARSVYLSTMSQAVGLAGHADDATANAEAEYLSSRVGIHAEIVAAIAAGDVVRTSQAVTAHRSVAVGSS